MAKDLMLDVDQAGELKAAFRREGQGRWINEKIKMLCERKGLLGDVLDVLDGTAKIVPAPVFGDFQKCGIAYADVFIVSEHYRENLADDAVVKVRYINPFFKECFDDLVEEASQATTFSHGDLIRDAKDEFIIAELGGSLKTKSSLGGFWQLLEKQGRGQNGGPLHVDGRANIMYREDKIRCLEDEQAAYVNERGERVVLRAVYALWFGDGWRVYAFSVLHLFAWRAGYRVFSRNSCGPSVPQAA